MLMPPSVGTADLQSQSALAPTLLASRGREAEIESESSDSQQEQGRNGDCIYFGWDFTPLLPYVLLLLGGTGMFFIQVPLLATNTFIPQVWIMATFSTLYAITFGCMTLGVKRSKWM